MAKPQTIDTINTMRRALRFARAELNPDVTAQRLLILLAVYLNEGLSQRELLGHLQATSITALSRNIADLSAVNTRKAPGPGLLELRPDPSSLRIKRVFLTRHGRAFVAQVDKSERLSGFTQALACSACADRADRG